MSEIRKDAPGFEFPCAYQIKAMGHASDDFDVLVVEIIRRHCERVREDGVSRRLSSNGKYVSVSVTIEAHSRHQLDAIYDDLTAHERVLMRL